MASFDQAFDRTVRKWERFTLTDHPSDYGRQTYAGISRRYHPRWEGWALIDADRPVPDGLVEQFYRAEFWNPIQGDALAHQAIAEAVFEWAVQRGPKKAVELALAVLGLPPTLSMLAAVRELNALPSWSEALGRLAVVAGIEVARDLDGNPRLTTDQVAGLIADSAGKLSAEQVNFVRVLAENERLTVLPEIANAFEALRNAHEGVVDAQVSSAYPLADDQLAEIVATLEQKYASKVKATVHVEPDLIGGVSIRIGDEVIDASVRGKLAQMASAMKL
jgi:F-type H+-transporting ATPase subunit delta